MPKVIAIPEKIKSLVSSRYIEAVFPSKEILEKFLLSGKRIRVYLGVDPTGPEMHLGHSTNFLLLKKFQELGHEVIFLIGDFTAQIGDPTGKSVARKALTKEEVLENLKSYQSQAGKILDFGGKNSVNLKFNSKWYEKMPLNEVIKLMAKATHGQMIKRDMFQERIKEGKEIYLHEFLYPLLQGYDSVELNADAEVGGNDQTFNMLVGRDLVKEYQKREKFVIATGLLINSKTQKKMMSKSEGSFIALNATAETMFGQIMSLPDENIAPCFELCTAITDEELARIKSDLQNPKVNPRDLKIRLAKEIVKMYHSAKEALKAEKEFNKIFRDKKLPSQMPEIKISGKYLPILDLLVKTKLTSSKSEAKRLVEGKAVEIDGKIISGWKTEIEIKNGTVIKAGKRKWVKIKT